MFLDRGISHRFDSNLVLPALLLTCIARNLPKMILRLAREPLGGAVVIDQVEVPVAIIIGVIGRVHHGDVG